MFDVGQCAPNLIFYHFSCQLKLRNDFKLVSINIVLLAIPDRRAAPRGTRITVTVTVAEENEDASGRFTSRPVLYLLSSRLFKISATDQSKMTRNNTSYSQKNSKSIFFPKYPCLYSRRAISRPPVLLLLSFLTLQKRLESSSTYQLSCERPSFKLQFVNSKFVNLCVDSKNSIKIAFTLFV